MDIFSRSFPDPHDEAIAGLNDEFRRTGRGGSVFLTRGVVALGKEKAAAVRNAVRDFDDFTEANDPYGEHDFGAFDFDGQTFFWKIDYYDAAFEYHAEDPADPTKTNRVLTDHAGRRVLAQRYKLTINSMGYIQLFGEKLDALLVARGIA